MQRQRNWFAAFAATLCLLSALAQGATVQYVYDDLGRLIVEINPAGDTTIYSYDPAGNLLSVARNPQGMFRIDSFSPSSGKAGDSVFILGAGFIGVPAQNTVRFNGSLAAVSVATSNALIVSVPVGASTGPITVSNANGSATTTRPFKVLGVANITATSPGFVVRGQTSRVEISGSNLDSAISVGFDQAGIGARIVTREAARLSVDLTVAGNVAFGSYPFFVTNFAGTGPSGAVTVTVTAALIGDAVSIARPVSVHLPAVILGAPTGNTISATAQAVTVHLPTVIQGAPPGNAMSATAQAVTVHLPAVIPGASPGNAMSTTAQSATVHLPAVTLGAPPGNSMSVSQPVSVLRP